MPEYKFVTLAGKNVRATPLAQIVLSGWESNHY